MSRKIILEYSDILKLEALNEEKTIVETLLEYEIFADEDLENLKYICCEFGIEDKITHENYHDAYSKARNRILKLDCL